MDILLIVLLVLLLGGGGIGYATFGLGGAGGILVLVIVLWLIFGYRRPGPPL